MSYNAKRPMTKVTVLCSPPFLITLPLKVITFNFSSCLVFFRNS